MVLLSCKIEANIMYQSRLMMSSDFEADLVLAYLAYAQSNNIDWLNSKALRWYLYNFTTTTIIAFPE